jgi:type IV pilus assembly protein PilQ
MKGQVRLLCSLRVGVACVFILGMVCAAAHAWQILPMIELPLTPEMWGDVSVLQDEASHEGVEEARQENASVADGTPVTDEAPTPDETPEPEETDPNAGQPSIKPVTLSVQDMEVEEILAMFSRSRAINIISENGVSGRVSIELHEVPFHQALEAVASMVGAQVIQRGNIFFVRKVIDEEERKGLLNEVRSYRLDYAPASEIEEVVKSLLTKSGKVSTYSPLRTVVVEDRPDVLRRLDSVIGALDVAPRQVLIEAQIIEARISEDLSFGVDWSLLFSPGVGTGIVGVEGFTTPSEFVQEGFFISYGEGDFEAAIESVEGIDELNTLTSPRLLAVDGTQAEIIIGGELGFSVVTTVDNTVIQSVEFLDVGAQLRITPTIAGDGYVLMKIHPEMSDGVIQEGLPSKTTAEVTTEVLIKDGHTLFIGGLIREREEAIRTGIPFLRRIPVLGALFGKTTLSKGKSELITLITPRILQPGESVDYASQDK